MEVPFQKSSYERPYQGGDIVTLDSLILSDSVRPSIKSELSVMV